MPTANELGNEAYGRGIAREDNPYRLPGASRLAWFTGWDAAQSAYR